MPVRVRQEAQAVLRLPSGIGNLSATAVDEQTGPFVAHPGNPDESVTRLALAGVLDAPRRPRSTRPVKRGLLSR